MTADPASATSAPSPAMWAIVELFGHVRRAGLLTEVELAGAGFLRLDIPDGEHMITQMISSKAIYAITPTTEQLARAAAGRWRPEPVRPWELESADQDGPEF